MQAGGEGCPDVSWIRAEADLDADSLLRLLTAKRHDKALPMGCGPENDNTSRKPFSTVQKRSFKRAIKRAQQTGSAWYRGQCMTLDQLTPGSITTTDKPQIKPMKPISSCHPRPPKHRMHIGHVNVGGLAQERLHEIKIWAHRTGLDILLLSETRWSFEAEWADRWWYHIHTGSDNDRADGLLFLIRKSLCQPHQIGFTAPMQGRIGHLRLHFQKRSMDILGCYQYAHTHGHHRMTQRSHFWQALEHHASKLPNRNSVLILGDFNCSAIPEGPYVGTNMYTWHGVIGTSTPHSDSSVLMEFLQKFQLTILNSWNAKNPPTFEHCYTASTIDHMMMRIADTDAPAKDVKFITAAPFLPLTGAKHTPMICSIRKIPYAFTRQAHEAACTYQQRLRCRRAWQIQDESWQQFHSSFTQRFSEFITTPHDDCTLIDDMHNQMMPVFHHAFPPEAQIPQPLSAPNQDQRHAIQQLWHHRAGILQCMQADVSSLFQVWFHYSRYKTMKRLQQRRTRLLKRQKLHDLLQEVAHASRCHDSFAVYQTIRKYTPKQPLKRIRLRLSDGTPANADQVMAMTKAYVEDIWHSADPIQLQQPAPVGIPFDLAELEVEIANIPITKAVARSCLPGICWKTHAKQVAEFFYAKLQTWWMQYPVFIPQQWKDAHLRFINKPAKPPDRLSHLRPLALLEPVGKCILGLLTTKFADAVQPLLSPWPQLAFMRQRSTFDAIRRVATHCVRIRQMTAAQRRSVHERPRQEQCYQVCGGLQVLLDANKAFDLVPRPTLFHFINGLPIDQVLVTLLSEWHTATNYIVPDGHNTQ